LKNNFEAHYRANSIQIAHFENKCLKNELFLLLIVNMYLGSMNCTVAGAPAVTHSRDIPAIWIFLARKKSQCSVPSMIEGFPTT